MTFERSIRAAWWLMGGLYALLLAAPSVPLPGDAPGIRRFRTPPVGPGLLLTQTFTMTGNGLRAIDVFPVAVGERASGTISLRLYEVRRGQLLTIRLREVEAEEIVRSGTYSFEFQPVQDSKDRTYQLDIVGTDSAGVAFWGTKGERYAGGSMYANGRERWADLAFRVHAPAPSLWARVAALYDRAPVRAIVASASFVAIWLLLGTVLRLLTAAAATPGQIPAPRRCDPRPHVLAPRRSTSHVSSPVKRTVR